MMPQIYKTTKAGQLLDAANMILHDQCPPTRAAYMCLTCESEEPCCDWCWTSYLLEIYNSPPH